VRGSSRTPDGSANPLAQVTVMNVRAVALVAGERERWPLAGDQLYVDLDLSLENLPAGSRLAVGDAVLEVTSDPHTGCAKFSARFGSDALRFVNSPDGRALRLRGLNARVVEPGTVRPGDAVRRL
jgi:MOSC domain-containing protein YiiM